MASILEVWSSVSRTLLHLLIGIAAILFVQVITASKSTVISIGVDACVFFIAVEIIRPNLYWGFSEDVVGKKRFRLRAIFGWFLQKLIDSSHWFLCKIKLLRPDRQELEYPATAINLASSILLSLLVAPLWAIAPAVAMFACGDAAARELGIRMGTYPLPWCKHWREPKTWGGIWAYISVSVLVGAVTVLLQEHGFRLYPPAVYPYVPVAIGITGVVGGVLESLIRKGRSLTSRIFDDNALVPLVTAMTFNVVVCTGAAL